MEFFERGLRDKFILIHLPHISDDHVQHILSHQVSILRVIRLINCPKGHHGLVILQALPRISHHRYSIRVSILNCLRRLRSLDGYSLHLGGKITIFNFIGVSFFFFIVQELLINCLW